MTTEERERVIISGTAEDAERKFQMGVRAAQRGKPISSCPYSVDGWAYRHWVRGHNSVKL